jgi:TetR/AcrR family fatty acid metabolism transcriptional regulator
MKENRPKSGNKRDIIIDAAIQVFSQKGYHNTRMEEIALAAGIGKGTIYEYFDSKLQLFQEMLGRSLETYYSSMSSEELDQLSIEERLHFMFETHLKFCYDNRELTKILFWDDVFDEELKEWSYKIHKEKENRMEALIKEGITRGEVRNLDTKLVTSMITGALQSLWFPLVLENWQIDPKEVSGQLTDIIMHGVAW